MSKAELKDVVISEIPVSEKVLKEGTFMSMSIARHNNKYMYKYVFTDKGIWMHSRSMLFMKAKTSFLTYTDISGYKRKILAAGTFLFSNQRAEKPLSV